MRVPVDDDEWFSAANSSFAHIQCEAAVDAVSLSVAGTSVYFDIFSDDAPAVRLDEECIGSLSVVLHARHRSTVAVADAESCRKLKTIRQLHSVDHQRGEGAGKCLCEE